MAKILTEATEELTAEDGIRLLTEDHTDVRVVPSGRGNFERFYADDWGLVVAFAEGGY